MPQETDQGNPFLERPDEHTAGAANELYCWLPGSDGRECNGSCVAYDPRFVEDQSTDSCKALNAFRSIALSLAVISKTQQGREKRAEIAARQVQTEKLPSPPKV